MLCFAFALSCWRNYTELQGLQTDISRLFDVQQDRKDLEASLNVFLRDFVARVGENRLYPAVLQKRRRHFEQEIAKCKGEEIQLRQRIADSIGRNWAFLHKGW
jgi:hypothetical protein